jgi:methylmalonyl-CoA decarboxylase
MFITVAHDNAIGVITLNQSAKRNALSSALVDECLQAFEDLRTIEVHAVILRATPDARVWSAGHDISELTPGQDPLRYADPLERLIRTIQQFPAPVIAMIHGSVWGGATELALSCDIIVGDETCSFAITPAKLGLAYNTVGLLDFMRRLPLNLVREMLFTARPVNAEDAVRWGILNHLVAAAELESFTQDLAKGIAAQSPMEIAAVKEQLRCLAGAASLAPSEFERIEAIRRRVYQGNDYSEGLKAFHEKRLPIFADARDVTAMPAIVL